MTVKIKMLTADNLLTDRGPMPLKKGETYEVPEWAAASLVGRGFALEVKVDVVAGQTHDLPPVTIDFDPDALKTMNIGELRDLAKNKQVEGYDTLKKAGLIQALQELASSYAESQSAGDVKPPPSPFEVKPLTGNVQAPEAKQE